MNKINQIKLIKKFITSDEKTIVVNQVNDNLEAFYLTIFKYFADQKNIKIKSNILNDSVFIEDDLFGVKTIEVYNITNSKKITSILNSNKKKIIFVDYKNYKKIDIKNYKINSYLFENDIDFFISDELKINNKELLYYCKNNPSLILSETTKYLINNNRYTHDDILIDQRNHILEIRKAIFENKRSNLNIKNLYLNIKKESRYKKFSFLTY